MDFLQERAFERIRKACGDLPDAAHVSVKVGDLLLALKAFHEAEDAEEVLDEYVSPTTYNIEVTAREEECERLEGENERLAERVADLEADLEAAMLEPASA